MFKAANAVQIRVSIDEIEPEVWRRLVLPGDWNLEHLHLGIQAAFNWWNYHLYEFRIGGLRYGEVEILTDDATDEDPCVFDQREVRLLDFEQGAVFSYHYDFGDGWRHTVAVEEFLDFWNFRASVSPFFGHWAGVLALPAVLTHYCLAPFR